MPNKASQVLARIILYAATCLLLFSVAAIMYGIFAPKHPALGPAIVVAIVAAASIHSMRRRLRNGL